MVIVTKPGWPDELTAWGTLAVAVVAVGVALFGEWRAGSRVRAERAHQADVLNAERKAADDRLQRQLEDSASQLQQQLDHASAAARTERDRAHTADAYLVQVTPARMPAAAFRSQITTEPGIPVTCPVVIVRNRGHYTITDVDARFSPDGRSVTSYHRTEHFSSYYNMRELGGLVDDLTGPEHDFGRRILTPDDIGMRFTHDALAEKDIQGCYPVVRWRDHHGQRWQHRLGIVKPIPDAAQWEA